MDSEDRISQLPNSLLWEILEYLPTKNIIATSILSTRWKNLFPFDTSPIELDLDDSLLLHPENDEPDSISPTFMHYVDKLLNEMLISHFCVPYITIKCHKRYEDVKFISWVRSALRISVEHLSVNFNLREPGSLFSTLNGCETLTRLELGDEISLFRLPNMFKLPNLKSLRLCGVVFGEDDYIALRRLVYKCPVLLDLHLSNCDFRGLVEIGISSLSLKNLFIENSWDESSCDFTLNAPNLEVLLFKNCLASGFNISSLTYLKLAVIDVGPFQLMGYDDEGLEIGLMDIDEEVGQAPWYNHWVYLVTACVYASRLYLNHWAIEAFQNPHYQLPTYHNLTFLSLGCIRDSSGWGLLAGLLCSAPNLETLALREGFKKCKDGYTTFESFVSTTPVCLQLHLKGIDIMISDEEDEIKLIEYLLKHGKVIESIHVNCFATSNWDGLDRLLGLPERSKIHLLMDWEPAGLPNPQVSCFDW